MINRYEFDSYRDRHEFGQLLRSHGSALRRRESCHLDVSIPVFSLEDMMLWTYHTKRTFCEVTGLHGLMAKVLNEAGSWECGVCQGQIIRRSLEQEFEFLSNRVSSLGACLQGISSMNRVKLLFSGGFSCGASNGEGSGNSIPTSRALLGADLIYFMRYAMGHGVRRIIMDGVLSKVAELSEELEDGSLLVVDDHGVQRHIKGLPQRGSWEVVVDASGYAKFSIARLQEAFSRVRQLGCDVLYVRVNVPGLSVQTGHVSTGNLTKGPLTQWPLTQWPLTQWPLTQWPLKKGPLKKETGRAGDITTESVGDEEWAGELLGSYAEKPYCESCRCVFPELVGDGALRQIEQDIIGVMNSSNGDSTESSPRSATVTVPGSVPVSVLGNVAARFRCVMPGLSDGEVLSVEELSSRTVEELSVYFPKLYQEIAAKGVVRPVASVLRHRFYVLKQLGLGHIKLGATIASLSRSERWRVVLGIVWNLRLRRGKMLAEEPLHYVSREEMGFFEACLNKLDERGWSLSVLSQRGERKCDQDDGVCITEGAQLDRRCPEASAMRPLSSRSGTDVDDGIGQLVCKYSATYNEGQSLALLRACRIVGMDAAMELRSRVRRLLKRERQHLATEAELRSERVISLLTGVLSREPSRAAILGQVRASLRGLNAVDCSALCVEHLMGMGISDTRWQAFLAMLVKLGLSDCNLAGELESIAIEDWQLFCLARALCFTPGQKGIIIFDRLDCGWSREVRDRVFHAMTSHTSRGGLFILMSTCPEQ